MQEITRYRYRDIHEEVSYEFYGSFWNQAKVETVSSDGYCKGGSYSDAYGNWKKVVVSGYISITIQDYFDSAIIDQNSIILRSGVHRDYQAGKCMDVDGGHPFWVCPPKSFSQKFVLLYEGMTRKMTDSTNKMLGQEVYTDNERFFLYIHSQR